MIVEDWRSHLSWMFEESERTDKPLAFDGYAGLGGWDDGLAAEDFLVLGCEIEPKIAALNKHPMICADFTTLNPGDFKGFDLIVGSPPCRDFCNFVQAGKKYWKRPPDPEGEGLRLVKAFLNLVEITKPTYWLMENNPRLIEYLKIQPRQITRLTSGKKRAFWGNYPAFLLTRDLGHPKHMDLDGKYKSWERARIPLPVARALGATVREALTATK